MHRLARAVSFSALGFAPFLVSGQATTPAIPASPTPQVQEGYKSPEFATLISAVVPGAGSMYAGNMKQGVFILGADALGWSMIMSGWSSVPANSSEANTGELVTLGATLYGMWAAYHSALNHNQRLQRAAMRVQPVMQLGSTNKFGRTVNKLGLSVRL